MLLLAAGRGTRIGGDVPKVFLEHRGRTWLQRSVERLARITERREIVLAVHPADRERWVTPQLETLQRAGLTRVVDGGATRQQSMRNALAASDPSYPLVLVHDAARPFFPVAAAREALQRAAETGAACLALPAPDTLKRVDADGRILGTLDRRGIWLAQTPQIARRELLLAALEAADRDGFDGTDDVSLLERHGATVIAVTSSSTNFKITTPADLDLAAQIANQEESP